MVKDYPERPKAESLAEREYLKRRMAEIEKGMGRLAGRAGSAAPITQEMDVLDRARELVSDMIKQVHVRSLDEAVTSQIAWLDRAEERLAIEDGEPKPNLNRIAVDRRLLADLLQGYQSSST